MSCFDDILCFIEDMIEFLICIITESIITFALALGIVMGTMVYMKRQYRLEQALRTQAINLNTEDTGPMPTSTGTSRPPVNQNTKDVPYMPYNNVPEGNLFLSSIFKQELS